MNKSKHVPNVNFGLTIEHIINKIIDDWGLQVKKRKNAIGA